MGIIITYSIYIVSVVLLTYLVYFKIIPDLTKKRVSCWITEWPDYTAELTLSERFADKLNTLGYSNVSIGVEPAGAGIKSLIMFNSKEENYNKIIIEVNSIIKQVKGNSRDPYVSITY